MERLTEDLLSRALKANPRENRNSNRSESSQDKGIKGMYSNEEGFFTHIVPKKFASVSLEMCDLQTQETILFAREWAKSPRSLFIFGHVGRGKTQLAFAMLREMFRRCPKFIWPRYLSSPDLAAKLLKASKSDEGDDYEVNFWAEQDLLFIDDFGRESGRESGTDRIRRQYFDILNKRYASNLPTLITSNFSFDMIEGLLGDAIASRFQEFDFLELQGPDLRSRGNI